MYHYSICSVADEVIFQNFGKGKKSFSTCKIKSLYESWLTFIQRFLCQVMDKIGDQSKVSLSVKRT